MLEVSCLGPENVYGTAIDLCIWKCWPAQSQVLEVTFLVSEDEPGTAVHEVCLRIWKC